MKFSRFISISFCSLFFVSSINAGIIWRSALDGNAMATVGADGAENGDPTATTDKDGNPDGAVLFDGSGDFYDIGNLGSLSAGSISAWIRSDNNGGERGAVAAGASGGGTSVYFTFMNDNGERIRVDLDDGATRRATRAPAGMVVGQWYHIATTWADDGIFRLYIDGVEVNSQNLTGDNAPYTLTNNGLIGSERTNGRYWDGAIDDVRIYDNEITAQDVTDLFNNGPEYALTNDSDGDGMTDVYELANGLDPRDNGTDKIDTPAVGDGDPVNGPNGDPDNDTLSNIDEFNGIPQTMAGLADTDGDTLNDNIETNDGSFDSQTTDTGTNPTLQDTDGDGLRDDYETGDMVNAGPMATGTDPNVEDSDGDLMGDGYEIENGLDPHSDDTLLDPDNDDSDNFEEFTRGTDPQDEDTDNDGIIDGDERPEISGTDPLDADSDDDLLLDGVETNDDNFIDVMMTGTDPTNPDSDGDGFTDQTEIVKRTNPNNTNEFPTAPLNNFLFVGSGATPSGGDVAVFGYVAWRYGLDAVTYMQASAATAADADGRELVILSSTVASGDIRNKYFDLAVPVLNWEEAITDNGTGELGLSSIVMTKSRNTSQMNLTDHPITDGLPATIDLFTGNNRETISTFGMTPGLIAIGTAADGSRFAGSEDPAQPGITDVEVEDNPMLIIAEKGDPVDAGTGIDPAIAPERRVAFPMTDSTFDGFTDDAKQLFGQSIDWAAGLIGIPTPIEIVAISYDRNAGEITLEWNSEPVSGVTYTVYAEPDLTTPQDQWFDDIAGGVPTNLTGNTTTTTFAVEVGVEPELFFIVRKD